MIVWMVAAFLALVARGVKLAACLCRLLLALAFSPEYGERAVDVMIYK